MKWVTGSSLSIVTFILHTGTHLPDAHFKRKEGDDQGVGVFVLRGPLAGRGRQTGEARPTGAASSPASHPFVGAPTTVRQLALAEVANGMSPPKLEPTAFELHLLATRPLTYAVYREALAAMAACAERNLVGLQVSFEPDHCTPSWKPQRLWGPRICGSRQQSTTHLVGPSPSASLSTPHKSRRRGLRPRSLGEAGRRCWHLPGVAW